MGLAECKSYFSRSKMVSKKARAAAACAGLGGPGPRG